MSKYQKTREHKKKIVISTTSLTPLLTKMRSMLAGRKRKIYKIESLLKNFKTVSSTKRTRRKVIICDKIDNKSNDCKISNETTTTTGEALTAAPHDATNAAVMRKPTTTTEDKDIKKNAK